MAEQTYNFQNQQVVADPTKPVGSQVISSTTLQPQQAVDLSKSFEAAAPDTSSSFLQGLNTGAKTLQSYTDALTPKPTQVDQAQQAVLDQITSLTGQSTGKQAYQLQQENQYGLPDMQKNLADVNAQIQIGLADLNKQDAQLAKTLADQEQGRAFTGVIQGRQAGAQRQAAALKMVKTAEVGLLQARAMGLNGQIQTALQLASRAVDMKYQPIEDDIKVRQAQLAALKPLLDKQQNAQAMAQQVALQDRQRALDAQKEKEKTIQDLALKASSFGAPPSVVNAIGDSKSIVDAINAAGKYTSDPLERILKQTQIDSNRVDMSYKKAQIEKIAQDIAASKKQLEIATAPGSTNDFSVKLLNSAVNKDNLSQSEREKIAKALTVVGQLDSLQSNIAKQNKTGFFKGKVQNFMASIGQNSDVGTINAQLQAIVPNLARGTYGEVGVLTDNDIANYRRTLPNLISPKDQNDAVLALTLKTVRNSIKNTLSTAANSGINVSGFVSDYNTLTKQINDIESRIGVSRLKVNEIIRNNMNLGPMIKELYANGASDSDVLEALGAN